MALITSTTHQSQTSMTYQSPALPPRVSPTTLTQHNVSEHRVFSVYSPTVTFTSDSGATDILMRQCDSHILLSYTTYSDTATRPGFDVANFQQIYPIAHGKFRIPDTTILLTISLRIQRRGPTRQPIRRFTPHRTRPISHIYRHRSTNHYIYTLRAQNYTIRRQTTRR